MQDTKRREHQLALLEMLKEIDRICCRHDVAYTLFAGSALGAVRHQGFIPWDDDLDIAMLRPDYERFLAVAAGELGVEYYLQREYSEHWPMFFSKLRKNNTACIERYIPKDPQTHQGIYIDIFPCDNLAEGKLTRKLQFWASKVVIAKALDRRGYLTDSKMKKLFMALCRLVPGGPVQALAQGRKLQDSTMVHCFFGAASRYEKSIFPRQWLQERTVLPFEDGTFPVTAHYDAMLTVLYGDYMTPTPESQRGCKVHAELVDLENSYEKYAGIQKTMKFREYTRSIR